MTRYDTRGLLTLDLRPKLDTPSYKVLENTLIALAEILSSEIDLACISIMNAAVSDRVVDEDDKL